MPGLSLGALPGLNTVGAPSGQSWDAPLPDRHTVGAPPGRSGGALPGPHTVGESPEWSGSALPGRHAVGSRPSYRPLLNTARQSAILLRFGAGARAARTAAGCVSSAGDTRAPAAPRSERRAGASLPDTESGRPGRVVKARGGRSELDSGFLTYSSQRG